MNSPASLVDDLMAQLQGAPLQQMAQQLGTSPAQAQDAVGAALPLLLGALGRNAAQPQGAMDLFGALQRDHGGGADLGGFCQQCPFRLGGHTGGLFGGGGARNGLFYNLGRFFLGGLGDFVQSQVYNYGHGHGERLHPRHGHGGGGSGG